LVSARDRQSTPAGDDYLVGHFVGLWSSAGADDTRQRFIADLGKSLREMASRPARRDDLGVAAIAVPSVLLMLSLHDHVHSI